jgi:hypothetical protein
MKKITYTNTMSYEHNPNRSISAYRIEGNASWCNRGELCESIAKFHRGIFEDHNPNTSYDKGSDIEAEHASVKSPNASLGHSFGGAVKVNDIIKYYFKHVASSKFIYVHFDERTQIVCEYQMNKREFGAFIRKFTRYYHSESKNKDFIRIKTTTKEMLRWFEQNVTIA